MCGERILHLLLLYTVEYCISARQGEELVIYSLYCNQHVVSDKL